MRRKIISFLIIPILLIFVVGCSLDQLSDFMGKAGENVLIKTGTVTVNTTQGDNVVSAIGNLFGGEGGEIDQGVINDLKEDLKTVLDSPEKTKDLKNKLSKELEDDDLAAANKAKGDLETVLGELGLEDGFEFDITTEADLLVASLALSLFESVNDLGAESDETTVMAVLSDAVLLLDTINALSPTGLVDLGSSLEELLGEFMGRGRSVSRSRGDEDDFEFIEIALPVIKNLVRAMDSDNSGELDDQEFNTLVRNYAIMRKTYESMAETLIRDDGTARRRLKFSDQINYVLSVLMTEGSGAFEGYKFVDEDDNTLEGFRGLLNGILNLVKYLDANPNVNVQDVDPVIYVGDLSDPEIFPGGDFEDELDAILNNALDNLIKIAKAVPNNSLIVGELEKLKEQGE
ncbi:MAG: hypothetical protein WDA17_03640 [Sphaerochaetaceae bacterium]